MLRVHTVRMPLAPAAARADGLRPLAADAVSGARTCAELAAACREAALHALHEVH